MQNTSKSPKQVHGDSVAFRASDSEFTAELERKIDKSNELHSVALIEYLRKPVQNSIVLNYRSGFNFFLTLVHHELTLNVLATEDFRRSRKLFLRQIFDVICHVWILDQLGKYLEGFWILNELKD